jgi:poly(A) polymerase/tRNA nucleotidyltransferase (CCA-adding enzyme)
MLPMKTPKDIDFFIPEIVKQTICKLKEAHFEAYIVGGCVRDILIGRKPKDWDLTTNATPEEIQEVFPDSFYENKYGTVGIKNDDEEDETLKVIEVTPYRIESDYSDNRRPDNVSFSKNIIDDLQRRDFTVNAIAVDVGDGSKGHIIDLYKGQEDLALKTIRTVGTAEDRFKEDGLRILRAVRLATDLGFVIEENTQKAIEKHKDLLKNIAKERIRDEFVKIIMSDNPLIGIVSCEKLGILKYICLELEVTIGVTQNQAHAYDVWEHLLRTVQHSADKKFGLEIRLSALFHDIGKPKTRHVTREKAEPTFYGHDVVGERITRKILEDLKFSREIIEKVAKFVRWHMFFSDPDLISLSAVRRMVANVGKENIWDLMHVRECDRIGTGRPKENPYRLRKYKAMIEQVMHDPVSVGMLKIDGNRVMEVTHETPGPKIGFVLHALLEEVMEDPSLNRVEYLETKTLELVKLDLKELKRLSDQGKELQEKAEEETLKEIKKKHKVK